MAFLTNPSRAFPIALIYITVGTLIDVWTVVGLIYYPPDGSWSNFLTMGFLATGTSLLVIGLLLGHIGRAARNAELPPAEVTPALAQAEQTAASHPPPVVPVGGQFQQAPEPAHAKDTQPVRIPVSSNVPFVRR